MAECYVVLAPELGISTDAFADAWNADEACRATSAARPAAATEVAYDPTLLAGAMAVLSGLALGVGGNALYDLIKAALRKALAPSLAEKVERIEIIEQPQRDGSRLLVVIMRQK